MTRIENSSPPLQIDGLESPIDLIVQTVTAIRSENPSLKIKLLSKLQAKSGILLTTADQLHVESGGDQ